jgi:hypothetical protein
LLTLANTGFSAASSGQPRTAPAQEQQRNRRAPRWLSS